MQVGKSLFGVTYDIPHFDLLECAFKSCKTILNFDETPFTDRVAYELGCMKLHPYFYVGCFLIFPVLFADK